MKNDEARGNLECVVAALEEFKAGLDLLKEKQDEGDYETVGVGIADFQRATCELSKACTHLLEGMREHSEHECPECAKREDPEVRAGFGDACPWCNRSCAQLAMSKVLTGRKSV